MRACIEHDLKQLYDWFGVNSLTLNIGKTNLLLFDYRKNDKTEFHVLVNGTTLTPIKSAKFLGVILDDKLTWKDHIEQLKVKLKRSLGMIHRGKNLLNCHGLKMLYYAQFYSHLSYCIVIWGSMITFEKKQKLKTMQNNCVKVLDPSKCLDEIYRKHKILKFDELVNLEQNKLGYKMNNNLLPLNLANVLLTDRIGKTLKKQHRYSTRQKEHPNLPNHRSKLYNDSFLVQSIKSYNNLNADIKT